jgi:uncharacterized YigZ family protein
MTDDRTRPRYLVPARGVRIEDRIEKSHFIASAARATTADDARRFVDSLRAEFPDATHHCFAFVAGPPGSSTALGSSDDGEPSGTAGRPMLSVLMNSGIGEIVVVVTRYFGGVKLGKGGLVRAYTGAVQHALRELVTMERVTMRAARVVVSYARADAVRRAIARGGCEIVGDEFAAEVTFDVSVPDDRAQEFERALRDETSGVVRIEWTAEG